jgi:hypothetical protein
LIYAAAGPCYAAARSAAASKVTVLLSIKRAPAKMTGAVLLLLLLLLGLSL